MFSNCFVQVLRATSANKCKLLDFSNDEVIVAEGRWLTQDANELVNGLPLGPKAVKVFVDSVLQPETFIWRPTIDTTYLEDCLMAFVSWHVNKVAFDTSSTTQHSASTDKPAQSKSAKGAKSTATVSKSAETTSKSSATGSESPIEDTTCPISKVNIFSCKMFRSFCCCIVSLILSICCKHSRVSMSMRPR